MEFWQLLLITVIAGTVLVATMVVIAVLLFKRSFKTIKMAIFFLLVFGVIVAISGIDVSKKIWNKGKEVAEEMSRDLTAAKAEAEAEQAEYEQEHRKHQEEMKRHINKIRSWADADEVLKGPKDFYTYSGFRDWWRFPLVFPYEISTVDSLDFGHLNKCFGSNPIETFSDESEHVQGFSNLTHISYNGKFFLGRQQNVRTDSQKLNWVFFEFKSGKFKKFTNKSELFDHAEKMGYPHNFKFKTIKECFDESF